MRAAVTLTYDDTPPSSNTNAGVGGRGNPHAVARTKRTWEGIFGMLLLQAGVPRGCSKVRVRPRLQFRTANRRDSDNFVFAVSKPMGDALVKGGWLADDDYTRYECERPEIEVGIRDLSPSPLVKSRIVLDIEYER